MAADSRPALPAWVSLAGVLALATVAFGRSLSSVFHRLGSTDAASLALIAPLVGASCLVIAVVRDGPPPKPKLEPALLGAIPAMLAALLLVVFGPGRLGFTFWYLRLDLAALVAFVMSGLMVAFGVRAVVRHGGLLAAVLCLPPLALPLARMLEGALSTATLWSARKLAIALPLGVDRAQGDSLFHASGRLVSVAAECSGLEGIAIVLAVGAPLAVGTSGSGRRTALVVVAGLGAGWMLNLARVTVLLGLAGHGHMRAFRALHGWGGVVMIAVLVAGMLVLARRLGLRWHAADLRDRVSYTTNHVAAAGVLLVVGVVCVSSGLAAQAADGLRATDVSHAMRMEEWTGDDGTKLMALRVPGHQVRYDRSYPWFRQFFGAHSRAASFTITRYDGSHPVWAQVITATSLRSLDQYAPVDCALAHHARIVRVRRVPLGGGAAVLIDEQLRGRHFGALSWTQPVRLPDGSRGFRRVQLFADARRGSDQRLPRPRTRVQRFAYAVLDVLTPYPDSSPGAWSYGPADRELESIASSMLAAGT